MGVLGGGKPDDTEAIIQFNAIGYRSARQELIERIKQRDNAVRIYLSVSAALFAFVAAYEINEVIRLLTLLVIGVYSVALSQSVANNQIKIAAIGYFIEAEFFKSFENIRSRVLPLDWECSETNKRSSRTARLINASYYYVVFSSFQMFSIIYQIIYLDNTDVTLSSRIIYILASVVLLLVTVFTQYVANRDRYMMNKERNHR